jgi:DNA-binding NarL/FixJ family response regulator
MNLIIIEDDETIRRNLVTFGGFQQDIEVLADYSSVEDFMKRDQSGPHIDVMILDIGLPGMSGLDALPLLKEKYPELDIIMLTAFDEHEKIFQALQSGACSYLAKSTSLDNIFQTVRIVYNGGSYMSPSIARKLSVFLATGNTKKNRGFTPKQLHVMNGLVDGLSYKEIASQMGVSIDTIRTHIKRIYQILHVKSKAAAVAKYLKN